MKSFRFALLALASLLTIVSCEPKPEEPASSDIKEDIRIASTSIKEGGYADPIRTNSIIVDFTPVAIALSPKSQITLNNQPVTALLKGMTIEIAVALEAEQNYTLVLPSGTVNGKIDPNRTNPAFTLHFHTIAGAKPDGSKIDVAHLVDVMGFGWNLGNHFDTGHKDFDHKGYPWGWWDGTEPTEQLYTNLVANGIKTLRMPITWGNNQGYGPDYTIKPEFMADVKKNVDWALNAGLYVLINTHHDEYWQDAVKANSDPLLKDSIAERITKTWEQIAQVFKDYDDEHLIYETFNEINDSAWGWGSLPYAAIQKVVDDWNQLAVNVIRQSGGKNVTRWIGVPAFCASPIFTLGKHGKPKMQLPNDPANKIMVAVHSYDPFEFCTKGTIQRWGHTYKGNDEDEKNVENLFNELKKEYIDKGIPCYVGEFGCVTRKTVADEAYRKYFLEYFCRASYFAGIPVMLWDNNNNTGTGGGGECFWYINHQDGSLYTPELIKLMHGAATSTVKTYTLESIYNNAPK